MVAKLAAAVVHSLSGLGRYDARREFSVNIEERLTRMEISQMLADQRQITPVASTAPKVTVCHKLDRLSSSFEHIYSWSCRR